MKREVLFAVVLLMLFSVVSADIYIDDDAITTYNVGDEVVFSFELTESLPVADYVSAILDCGGDESRVIFKQYVNFANMASKTFNVSSLADLTGDCHIEVLFRDQSARTGDFQITDLLDVEVFLSSRVYMPGDLVRVNGSVSKKSGDDFNVSVEVTLDGFVKRTLGIVEGNFGFNFSVDSDFPSGDFPLKIYFEESDLFGNVINSYTFYENVSVLSKPKSIRITTHEDFKPSYDLPLKVELLDQSDNLIEGESVVLKIYDNDNGLFYDSVVMSGSESFIYFPSDSAIGGWRINAFYASISAIKPIYVSENRQVDVSFENGTSYVVITNLGNIPYQGIVEVTLHNSTGDFIVPINVDIEKGASFSENLGHVGEFNVSSGNRTFSNVYITGAVISSGGIVNYMWLTIIIVVVVLLVVFFFFSKYKFNISKRQVKKKDDSSDSGVLVSNDGGVRFKFGWNKKKKESDDSSQEKLEKFVTPYYPKKPVPSEPSRKSVSVSRDSNDGPFALFRKNKQERELDVSRYANSNVDDGFIQVRATSNRDIPVVRNTLREINTQEVKKDFDELNKPRKKVALPPKKRVYSIFFRNDSEELSALLKKYGLSIYKVGDMRFSLLKSSRSPENLLVNLAKMVITQTDNKDVLIHSMEFSESTKLSSIFGSIKDILREGEGILISDAIFPRIKNKKDFVYFRNLRAKESIIKLYRFIL